jgi:hypothetical protein
MTAASFAAASLSFSFSSATTAARCPAGGKTEQYFDLDTAIASVNAVFHRSNDRSSVHANTS